MKRVLPVLLGFFCVLNIAFSQKYFTKTAVITFESKTPMENIEAVNKSGTCVADMASGNVEFAVLVKGFQFEKALMQEHFNENYMESTKFPKATFKGKLNGAEKIDRTKNGKHNVKASGQMTVHGVTKPQTVDVVLEVKDGKIIASSNFSIAVADYNIAIPSLVKDNIAKIVNVKVNANLEPLK